jgi:hypothetical protein
MCQICYDALAVSIIDIEVNEFRGDDEVLRACENCKRLTPALMLRQHAEALAQIKAREAAKVRPADSEAKS